MAEKKEKTEHEYLIPLRGKYQHVARYKKTPKAIKSVKEFVARHMKVYNRDLNKIKLDKYVNEYLWARGIKNPPHEIKVKVKKDSDGIVDVELVDYPDKLKFKKIREDKSSKEAKEAIEKKKSLKERMQETMKVKTKSSDENNDGIEDKKEEEIKEEASAEAEEKIEENLAKKEKKTTKGKSGKEKLAEKKKLDQRSQHK